MNAKQSSRFNAMVSVLGTLNSEKAQTLISNRVALVKAVSDLQIVVDKIMVCAEKQEAKDGATAQKAAALAALGDAAIEIAAGTKAYAVATGDQFLTGQMDFSRSEIVKGRDSSVLARCQTIHDAASEHVDDLADYDVTLAKLKTLEKKIEAFREVRSKHRQSKASSSAATKELPKLFRKASEILTQRLDGLMVPFKTTEPTFYGEYQAARLVIDTSARSNGANIVPGTNTTPTAQAA